MVLGKGYPPSTPSVNCVKSQIEGKRWLNGTKQYCMAATLDVKNAFNSASWHHTLNALSNLNVPVYIQRVIAGYFEGRLLLYETDSGQSTHRVTGGVPQGSVLGPLLWNAMYDGILRITMPEGARLNIPICIIHAGISDARSHVIGDQSSSSRVALLYTPPLCFEAIEHVYRIASGF